MSMPLDRQVRFAPMQVSDVAIVSELEKAAYSHPWTPGNLMDAVHHLNHAQLLLSTPLPGEVSGWQHESGAYILGYFVALQGVDEVHLLNITVAPAHRRQGWASLMLSSLAVWSQGLSAERLLLEVREGNIGAKGLYERLGFTTVGHRKGYYPLDGTRREDAVVMQLALTHWTVGDTDAPIPQANGKIKPLS
ncbi:MAG: GNAT family N-acetyltransferase [Burkholderiaceae bacterium]|jgi:ribosomal-protein-alanine N-acetyltransferase|nr:GNAT family N-acetyltransferase [Burkholderiaceae bacterium]MDP4698228.1 GNAT family N-acetyltransferase [Burkholderiaceae bacterium]